MIVPPSKQLHLQIYPSSFSIKFGNLIAFHYHIFSHSSIWPSLSLMFYSWIYSTVFQWCQQLKHFDLRRYSVLLQVIYCPSEYCTVPQACLLCLRPILHFHFYWRTLFHFLHISFLLPHCCGSAQPLFCLVWNFLLVSSIRINLNPKIIQILDTESTG